MKEGDIGEDIPLSINLGDSNLPAKVPLRVSMIE
jgi:hypothetical protein